MINKEHNKEMIVNHLSITTENWNNLVEIRVFGATKTYERYGKIQRTFKKQGLMGYFDNGESLIKELEGIEADAIYYTINPVKPALKARAKNILIDSYGKPTTSDKDIVKRKWLLIDVDPIRESGIPSTNEQHKHSKDKVEEMWKYLHNEGWENPLVVNSGNGYHLHYKIDINTKDDGVIEQLLKRLADRFDDDIVKVDTGVFNPSRICRLPGTMNRKGSDCPEEGMPHRMANLDWHPEEDIKIIEQDKIKNVANWQESEQQDSNKEEQHIDSEDKQYKPNENKDFKLQEWLNKNSIEYSIGRDKDGYQIFRLKKCPFEREHIGTHPSILKFNDTSYGYKCFGERCTDKTWKDLKTKFDVQWSNEGQNEEKTTKTVQWDNRPTKLTLPMAMELNPDMVPELIWDYSSEISDKINTHKEYVAISMLAAISSTIGRKFCMKVSDTFKIQCNNFHILLGTSSQNKSSPMDMVMAPIIKLDSLEANKYHKLMEKYKEKLKQREDRIEKIYDEIKELENKKQTQTSVKLFDTEDIINEQIEELQNELDTMEKIIEPAQKYCYIDDTSESALNNALLDNPNGILFYNDESASLFDSFTQKYNNGLKSFLLKAWSGNKPHRVIRGGTGTKDKKIITIPNALVSILGSIQPDVFKKFLENRLNITSGFAHRFQMIVMPEESEEVYEFEEQPIDRRIEKRYHNVIEKLYNYPEEKENGGILSRTIIFEDDAQQSWKDYHERLVNWTRNKNLPEIYKSHFKKYDYLMPGLCLIYHLIENPIDKINDYPGRVSIENVRRAERMTEFLATHAIKIFSITDTEINENKSLIELLIKIKEMTFDGKLTIRNLKKATRARIYGNIEENLETLETMGWIRYNTTKTRTKYVELNPLYDTYYPENNFKVASEEVLFRDFWN